VLDKSSTSYPPISKFHEFMETCIQTLASNFRKKASSCTSRKKGRIEYKHRFDIWLQNNEYPGFSGITKWTEKEMMLFGIWPARSLDFELKVGEHTSKTSFTLSKILWVSQLIYFRKPKCWMHWEDTSNEVQIRNKLMSQSSWTRAWFMARHTRWHAQVGHHWLTTTNRDYVEKMRNYEAMEHGLVDTEWYCAL
jgi:hypothetical protein